MSRDAAKNRGEMQRREATPRTQLLATMPLNDFDPSLAAGPQGLLLNSVRDEPVDVLRAGTTDWLDSELAKRHAASISA